MMEYSSGLSADALTVIRSIDVSKIAGEDLDMAFRIAGLEMMILAKLKRFDEAVAKAREMPSRMLRGGLLFVASEQIAAGDRERGLALWNEAMGLDARQDTEKWKGGLVDGREYAAFQLLPMEVMLSDPPLLPSTPLALTLAPQEAEQPESAPLLSTLVAASLAKSGLFSEAKATARLLKYEEDYADALTKIAEAAIDSHAMDQALATLAEAKQSVGKIKRGEATVNTLLSIARVEAKAGAVERARQTLAEALACTEALPPRNIKSFSTARGLPSIIKSELQCGFFEEAIEHCGALIDSEDKTTILERIDQAKACRQHDAKVESMVEKVLRDPNALSQSDEETSLAYGVFSRLVDSERFAEALAAARTIQDDQRKGQAFEQIAQKEETAKRTSELADTVAEWFPIACRIVDWAERERQLDDITGYQHSLGMEKELQDTLRERLAGAERMDAEGIRPPLPWQDNSAFASIAADQIRFGNVADGLAITRKIKGPRLRFQALAETLARLTRSTPEDRIREIYVEALAAAREDKEREVNHLMNIACYLVNAKLEKDADNAMTDLLAMIRDIPDLETRAKSLCQAACIKNRNLFDGEFRLDKSVSEETKAELVPLLQEAVATARQIEDAESRAHALGSIAAEEANIGFLTEAASLTREVEPPRERVWYLRQVAEAYSRAKDERVKEILTETFSVAKTIDEPFWRDSGMRSAIDDMAEAHFFAEALQMARGLEGEDADKVAVLRRIAEVQGRAGLGKDARKTLGEALAAVRRIEDRNRRATALREIAVALKNIEPKR
jgi:hypothetical protein